MEREATTRKKKWLGCDVWQIAWLVFSNIVILGIAIYQKDDWFNIVTALSGVVCVILCGMGKVSNYFFGTINILLYAYVAFNAKYYGDVMLNLLYYFPTNILGWIVWAKNVNHENNEVYKKRLTIKQDVYLTVISVIGVLGYSLVLKALKGNLPIVDSISTVGSIIAQILMINRYAEQWVIWIVVDIITVIMWLVAYVNGDGGIAVLLMWMVYLTNAVIMFIHWMKEAKKNE